MKHIIIVGHGDMSTLENIRTKYPDMEVITLKEAEERGIDLDRAVPIDHRIPQFKVPELKTPYFEDIRYSGKKDTKPWKRRGKNNKV